MNVLKRKKKDTGLNCLDEKKKPRLMGNPQVILMR